MRRRLAVLTLLAALLGGTAGAVVLIAGASPAAADGLVAWTACEDLVDHHRAELRRSWNDGEPYGPGYRTQSLALSFTSGSAESAAADAAGAAEGTTSGTGTNVQEGGVDEPDRVKLSDGRLAVVVGRHLRLLSGGPRPQELGRVRLVEDAAGSAELLVVGDRVLVLVDGWSQRPVSPDAPSPADRAYSLAPGSPRTTAVLVDVATDAPRVLETTTQDGRYVSSRLVDGTVRVVTQHTPTPRWEYPRGPGAARAG